MFWWQLALAATVSAQETSQACDAVDAHMAANTQGGAFGTAGNQCSETELVNGKYQCHVIEVNFIILIPCSPCFT